MRSVEAIIEKLKKVERQYLLLHDNQSGPGFINYYYGWHHALEWVSKRGDRVIVEGVVGSGRCSGCAACVAICPTNVYEHPVNTRLDQCIDCDLCVESCPELHLSDAEVFRQLCNT
jgi:formate hydrogenlyase subunit 6/NADH:ubiquinone oxidoreductase subunit I